MTIKIEEKIPLPNFAKQINISKIENILEKEAEKNSLSLVDYLNYMIAYESEKALVKEDMKIIEDEMKEFKNSQIQLHSLDSLLYELDE